MTTLGLQIKQANTNHRVERKPQEIDCIKLVTIKNQRRKHAFFVVVVVLFCCFVVVVPVRKRILQ